MEKSLIKGNIIEFLGRVWDQGKTGFGAELSLQTDTSNEWEG